MIAGIAVGSACASAPQATFPAAALVRRPYVDTARQVWGGTEPRPLVTLVWYPTDDTTPTETLGLGPPSAPLFVAGVVTPGAPIAAGRGPYPLILLSHGTGGSAVQMGWLGIALARRGYIAAAINHHGNTGAEPRYDARGFLLWWERARDASAVIDRLLGDPVFAPHIDRGRIGAAGFSLGGYTALALAGARTDLQAYARFCGSPERDFTCEPQPEMPTAHEEFARLRMVDPVVQASLERAGDSYRDERVSAVAALAPAVGQAFSAASLRRVEIPVLLIGAEADSVAPPATNADSLHTHLPRSKLLRLPAVGHYTFLSGCTADGRRQLAHLCGEREGIRREAIHEQVATAVDAFFARAWLVRR